MNPKKQTEIPLGKYPFLNAKFRANDCTWLIAKRKNPANKPPHFLLKIDASQKRQYISSLFPCPPDISNEVFRFDFGDTIYQLKHDANFVEIEPVEIGN